MDNTEVRSSMLAVREMCLIEGEANTCANKNNSASMHRVKMANQSRGERLEKVAHRQHRGQEFRAQGTRDVLD